MEMSKKFKFATKPLKYNQKYFYWEPAGYFTTSWSAGYFDTTRFRLHRVFLKEKHAKQADNFIKEFIRSNPEPLNYLTSAPEQGTEVWYGSYMTGDSDDSRSINFDINNWYHKELFDNFRLYKTSEDVTNASNLINLALKTEYKRQKYKFLTEPPEQGTPVYYPDFDNRAHKFCVAYIHYNSTEPRHVLLFKRGMLFLKEKHAIRVSKKILQRINPLACELTFKPTI